MAVVFFREGIHSSNPGAYIGLLLILNFLLFGGVAYGILTIVRSGRRSPTPQPEGPVKGTI